MSHFIVHGSGLTQSRVYIDYVFNEQVFLKKNPDYRWRKLGNVVDSMQPSSKTQLQLLQSVCWGFVVVVVVVVVVVIIIIIIIIIIITIVIIISISIISLI